MEVMIDVPLVLPEQPLAVSALEERVGEWAAQTVLRPVGSCPACGETESRPAGAKARQVETVLGPVVLPRQRRR